jgi:hypothetical protein
MKLRKTDRRFNLHKYGFDCYVEFKEDDWQGYNRTTRYCRSNLGPEFWYFSGHVYEKGNWRGNSHHQGKLRSSARIYFRGEKYHTLLLMAMPEKNKETIHL